MKAKGGVTVNDQMDKRTRQQLEDALYQLSLDFDRMHKKREAKLYRDITFPYSLEEVLSRLSKDDMSRIRQRLHLAGLSALKKQELITELARKIPETINRTLSLFDRERFTFVKRIFEQGGYTEANDVPIDVVHYFMDRGLVFPAKVHGKKALTMPKEIINIFDATNKQKISNMIDKNTEWIQLVHGLLYFYGVLPTPQIKQFLEKYTGEVVGYKEIFDLLYDANEYYDRIEVTTSGWCDGGVVDAEGIIREQNIRSHIDYFPFTKKQLIEASKIDYFEKTEGVRRFSQYLRTHYEITQDEVNDIVLDCTDIMLAGASPKEVIEFLHEEIEIPPYDALNELMKVIAFFYNDTRQWVLKGYSPNKLLELERKELKPLPNIPMTQHAATKESAGADIIDLRTRSKVGRNDPCPCGSGQKFKRCCGK